MARYLCCFFLLLFVVMHPTQVFAQDRCIFAPVLMYHHVFKGKIPRSRAYKFLSVDDQTFRAQMQELKDMGYQVRPLSDLITFFNSGSGLPSKTAFITFDDGNKNVLENAFPILVEFQYPSTMFAVVRQMKHPLYISMEDAFDLSKNGMFIANHTFSHKVLSQLSTRQVREEVMLADKSFSAFGLNNPKVIAYPYGAAGTIAYTVVDSLGYELGFKAQGGSLLCASQRLMLPRIQVVNSSLYNQGIR